MTEAKIKEELSVYLFSTLAARMDVAAVLPRYDEGVDIILKKSIQLTFEKGIQFSTSGKSLSVQMKTTTRRQVEEQDGKLLYRLNVKNFNDLVFRKDEWASPRRDGTPLILVVHVLPDDLERWVEADLERQFYKLNGTFYWFYPSEDAQFSKKEKTSKELLEIPLHQKVGLDFFQRVFTLFY